MSKAKPLISKRDHFFLAAAMVLALGFYFKSVHLKKRAMIIALDANIATEQTELDKTKTTYGELSNRKPASVEGEGTRDREIYDKYLKSNANFANIIGALAKGDGKSTFLVNK